MSEQPAPYSGAPTDRVAETVARAVALLKAYGYFVRLHEGRPQAATEARVAAIRAILLAQDRLIALLAPSWSPERRAAVAMTTEPDGAIAEIEAKAREGRA